MVAFFTVCNSIKDSEDADYSIQQSQKTILNSWNPKKLWKLILAIKKSQPQVYILSY